ncbi:MAG TPA: SDR family oxidoreductase [Acidimicrobiales bacterium]|nr:SDR family oxidoreductase [Acidimicrobiales bacterium]
MTLAERQWRTLLDALESDYVRAMSYRVNIFDEKVAIVTGGGTGIGEALCNELARQGAHVVVADIDAASAQEVATSIARAGLNADARQVDVTRESEVRSLVEDTVSTHGRLDYLFNNAGIAIGGDVRDLTVEQWRRVLDVDLYGVLYGTLVAYPIMARQGFGHIVNVASVTGLVPQPINAPYATAKHAVVGLSLSLRLEGVDLGVNVSVVCPGYVKTSIYENVVLVNVDRAQVSRTPIKAIEAREAARSILSGVCRNQAIIIFPAAIRWAWRVYRLVPSLADRLMLPRVRQLRRSGGRSQNFPPGRP